MTLALPRPLGTLAYLTAWLVPWRPAFRVRAAQSGLTFYVHHRDTIGRHIAKYGTHEPLVTRWLSDYLGAAKPGIAIDVGANLGWHAVHAARQRNVDMLIAFEPDPFNAWLLDRNLAENGIENAVVDTRAVTAKPGLGRLHRYKSSNFGRHSLAADYGFGSRAVALTDLDGALEDLGLGERAVAVIKIDVEGFEPAVIAGASRTLARTEAIILEYSPDLSHAGALSTDDMMATLQAAGFTPFLLRSDGGTVRATIDELRGLKGSLDVVWLRAERMSGEVKRAMNENERGTMTIDQIADQNKRAVTPI
jgi:FkbM family methyltransferase